MNDPFESGFARKSPQVCRAEALVREYLDDLFQHLDRDRVRDSCARERALASIVRGIVGPLALDPLTRLTQRDLAEIAFGELEDRLGWFGEDASLLGLYAGVWPDFADEAHRRAEERYHADPYSRHGAYWHRCTELGSRDVAEWGQSREEARHTVVMAAIEGAAVAVGEE